MKRRSWLKGLILIIIGIGLLDALPGILIGGAFLGVSVAGVFFVGLILAIIISALFGGGQKKTKKGTVTKEVEVPAKKAAPSEESDEGALYLSREDAAKLRQASKQIIEIRSRSSRIRDGQIGSLALNAAEKAERIVLELRKQPDEIRRERQFLNYYLPTLDAVINKYRTDERSGIDISSTKTSVIRYLEDIDTALDKLYEGLFDSEKLDLSVEMEAMQMAFARDGLISQNDIIDARKEAEQAAKADEHEIKLELTGDSEAAAEVELDAAGAQVLKKGQG